MHWEDDLKEALVTIKFAAAWLEVANGVNTKIK